MHFISENVYRRNLRLKPPAVGGKTLIPVLILTKGGKNIMLLWNKYQLLGLSYSVFLGCLPF